MIMTTVGGCTKLHDGNLAAVLVTTRTNGESKEGSNGLDGGGVPQTARDRLTAGHWVAEGSPGAFTRSEIFVENTGVVSDLLTSPATLQ